MATYKEIQAFIKEKYGITTQTCWIAHIKEKCGLHRRPVPNRISEDKRVKPCPAEYEKNIKEAFMHFKMI
jgi:hypothetical protein